MRAFFHHDQILHDPRQFMRAGKLSAPTDVPQRARTLLAALERRAIPVETPPDLGREPALSIHSPAYVEFLATSYEAWQMLPGAGLEVLPNLSPYWNATPGEKRPPCRSGSIIAQAGYYLGDLAVPIGQHSWKAIMAASHTAAHAAAYARDSGRPAYALCRPSGHHARSDRASGFCYINNAAIAAKAFLEKYPRVAILDVDAHHGDGTQEIFYGCGDVLTVSVHVDPSVYFPFYTGYADEIGVGSGRGANLNIPLAPGDGDEAFAGAVTRGLAAIRAFGAQALVVSLGFDGHRDDPIGLLDITAAGYGRAGALIAACDLPILIVQEGGYEIDVLGDCLGNVLDMFAGK